MGEARSGAIASSFFIISTSLLFSFLQQSKRIFLPQSDFTSFYSVFFLFCNERWGVQLSVLCYLVCVRFLLFNLYRRAHLKKKTINLQDPRSTNETCSLLGYYARLRGSSVPTFRDNLSVPFQGSWTSWPLNMRPTRCPETSVQNYHSTLRNIPEEFRSHLHRGGSLRSRRSTSISSGRGLLTIPKEIFCGGGKYVHFKAMRHHP